MSTISIKKNDISTIAKAIVDHLMSKNGDLDSEALTSDVTESLTAVFKTFKPKRSRKAVDPAHPKRPLSGFILYSMSVNKAVRAKLASTGKYATKELTGAVAKEIGEQWGAMSDKAKAPFLAQAAENKATYDEEMKTYVPSEPVEPAPKKVRAPKPADAPKGATSSYFYYQADVREDVRSANPDAKGSEIGSIISAQWKALSDEEKAPYVEKARVDRERFTEEMSAYKAAHPEAEGSPAKAKAAPKPKASGKGKAAAKEAPKPKASGKGKAVAKEEEAPKAEPKPKASGKGKAAPKEEEAPKAEPKASGKGKGKAAEAAPVKAAAAAKPAPAKAKAAGSADGLRLFVAEQRQIVKEENPDWSATKVTAELQRQWKALDEDEQSVFIERAATEGK